MAQYRLLAPHIYHNGVMLETGTVVGDDTPYPWTYEANGQPMPPSNQMEGVDDDGKAKVEELHKKLYGEEAVTLGKPSEAVQAARDKEAADQKALDEGSAPVSPQQQYDRKVAEDQAKAEAEGMPKPAFVPPGPAGPQGPSAHTAPQGPHRTGQQAGRGVATPKAPEEKDG